MFGCSLLWLVALVSYSATDPAWFFNSVSASAPAHFAGRVGAFLAEAASQLLGHAKWLIPVFLGYLAWHYFWCQKIEAGYTKLVGAVMLLSSTAALLSLALGSFESPTSHFSAGGMIGRALSGFFVGFLNTPGAAILLLTLLAFSVILSTQFSFGQAFRALATYFRSRRGPLQ